MERIDGRLAARAAEQHGLITYGQARSHGLSVDQIAYRVRTGRWDRLTRKVYRLAGSPDSAAQRTLATCLAAADGAVGSHLTAAWYQSLWPWAPATPHVTVPFGSSARTTLAVVHRARNAPVPRLVVDGVPITPVARTLIDCAALLPPAALEKMAASALHQRLVTPRAIDAAWDRARRAPGRRGEVRLRQATEPWTGPIRPGSPAEVRLCRLLVGWGFPAPELQVPIVDAAGQVVARADAGWSDRRIGLEYDSTAFHGPDAWRRDNDRHDRVTACGWTLLHADKADLKPGQRVLQRALAHAWSVSSRRAA